MSNGWRVLLPEKIHNVGPESIADFAKFTSVSGNSRTPGELRSRISEFDAIILRHAELTEEIIENADNLKVIAKHGAGLDNVDIETASRKNIIVCNTPGINSRAVAEHTVTLMMGIRRNLLLADQNIRDGKWDEVQTDWDRFSRSEVQNDVVGLFAFGNVAEEVANLVTGLDMECIAYDPYVDDEALGDAVTGVNNKQTLFERSDVVSIHSPLTEETRHSVGSAELRALGEDGIIINTARGAIIDEDALVSALDQKTILGAGLDVLEEEPPSEDHPLFDNERVILTPHLGGLSNEATYNASLRAAENVRSVFEGDIPDPTVNREDLTKAGRPRPRGD
jgi:D-3-phosphoglycerate dehydrogenase